MFQVYYGGTMWNTTEIKYLPDGGIEFESQGKDGKYLIRLRVWDIITKQTSNIAVPLEVVKS